jgi:hypothetical protein
MMTETNKNRPTFLTISIVTICICGLLTLLNLSEFYTIGILKQTDGYPFGGEGPIPYYYQTAELYSTVNFIWGFIFLSTLVLAIKTTIKGQRRMGLIVFGITLFLLLTKFFHGQIGT